MDTIAATITPAPFDLIYARYGRRVLAYAFSWLRDRHAAEDVLQEAFSRLHQKMQQAGPLDGGAADFLFGVARSRIIDRVRRRGVRAGTVSLQDAPEPEMTGPTRMDGPVERAELHGVINRALLSLPTEQCEVLVLRVFAHFPFEKIARLTGAPLPTVASRYRYALEKLAPMLKELWVES